MLRLEGLVILNASFNLISFIEEGVCVCVCARVQVCLGVCASV